MKKIICSLLFVLIILCSVDTVAAYATDGSCEQGMHLSREEKNNYLNSLNLKNSTGKLEEFKENYIVTFDVSQEEHVAIGLDNDTILLCDNNAQVQHVLRFRGNDSGYYLNWDKDVLELIFARSLLTYRINIDGNVVDVSEKDPWSSVETEKMNSIIGRTAVCVNDCTYVIQKSNWRMKFLAGDNHDLLVKNANNDQIVLFETSQKSLTDGEIVLMIFLGLIVAVVSALFIIVIYKTR